MNTIMNVLEKLINESRHDDAIFLFEYTFYTKKLNSSFEFSQSFLKEGLKKLDHIINLKNQKKYDNKYFTCISFSYSIIKNSNFFIECIAKLRRSLVYFLTNILIDNLTEENIILTDQFKYIKYFEVELAFYCSNYKNLYCLYPNITIFLSKSKIFFNSDNELMNESIIDDYYNDIEKLQSSFSTTIDEEVIVFDHKEPSPVNQELLLKNILAAEEVIENKSESFEPIISKPRNKVKVKKLNKYKFQNVKRENIDKKLLSSFRKALFYRKKELNPLGKISTDFADCKFSTPFNYEGYSFKSVNYYYLSWLFSYEEIVILYNEYINAYFDEFVKMITKAFEFDEGDLKVLHLYLRDFSDIYGTTKY